MVIVHVSARITAEALESLREVAAKMVAATIAEPGCITYAFTFDMLTPGLMRIVEVWQDEAALGRHFKTAHMAEFQAAIKGKIEIVSAEKFLSDGPLPL
ncbi:MAG: putative quinol monooxygenase, partial [Gammaproteobacteria bacterium]